jgi:hypothetical protein
MSGCLVLSTDSALVARNSGGQCQLQAGVVAVAGKK